MMRFPVWTIRAVVIATLMSVSACAPGRAEPLQSTSRMENDVQLTGPMRDQVGTTTWPTDAMVCGMRHRRSTLSVRAAPGTSAPILAELPYYTGVILDGQRDAKGAWFRITGHYSQFDVLGRMKRPQAQTIATVGWVHIRYLCSFIA